MFDSKNISRIKKYDFRFQQMKGKVFLVETKDKTAIKTKVNSASHDYSAESESPLKSKIKNKSGKNMLADNTILQQKLILWSKIQNS